MDSIQSNVGTGFGRSAEEAVFQAAQQPGRRTFPEHSENLTGEQLQQQQQHRQAREELAATSREVDIAPPARKAVRFRLNRETESYYIQVVDQDTGEVVREIPPERILKLAETLSQPTGNLLDESA